MAPTTSSRKTRSATGHSTPRIVAKVEEAVGVKPKSGGRKKTTVKKSAAPKKPAAKANTSKPRTKKPAGTGAGVKKPAAATKKKTTTTTKAKKEPVKVEKTKPAVSSGPTLMGVLQGAALKVQGALTGKSGKKAAGTAKMRGTDTGSKKATK